MLEIGKVTAITDDIAQVVFERKSSCDKCKVCSMDKGGNVSLKLKNDIGAKVGDVVEVGISDKRLTQSNLIIFGIPLLMLLIGMVIASALKLSELYSILIGFGSLVFGFVIIFIIDKVAAKNNSFSPKILRVLNIENKHKVEDQND
jgi:positive regulator of sigma E activity